MNKLMTLTEVAGVLRVHPRTVRRLLDGVTELPSIRVGRRRLVRETALARFVRGREERGRRCR